MRKWIEKVADAVEVAMTPKTTREKLIAWGWISPSGESLTWEYWQRQGEIVRRRFSRG